MGIVKCYSKSLYIWMCVGAVYVCFPGDKGQEVKELNGGGLDRTSALVLFELSKVPCYIIGDWCGLHLKRGPPDSLFIHVPLNSTGASWGTHSYSVCFPKSTQKWTFQYGQVHIYTSGI